MKPETQYKLLVKVASADRAAGILARIAGAKQVKQAALAKRALTMEDNIMMQYPAQRGIMTAEANAAADEAAAGERAAAAAAEEKARKAAERKAKIKGALTNAGTKALNFATSPAGYATGVGLGAGALAGAGAYALTGLSPAMKKKKLLRILAALGAGGAVGVGAGLGFNKLMDKRYHDIMRFDGNLGEGQFIDQDAAGRYFKTDGNGRAIY